MLPIILTLALAAAPVPIEPTAPLTPRDVAVTVDHDGADRGVFSVQFQLANGAVGDLWIDAVEGVSVEAEFTVDGVPHVWLRHVEGEEPDVWFSPEIEADPEIMRHFWGAVGDIAVRRAAEGNPLCGAAKWGLRGVTWLAVGGCCVAATRFCGACLNGGLNADGAIRRIDCSKNCKPDCPIP